MTALRERARLPPRHVPHLPDRHRGGLACIVMRRAFVRRRDTNRRAMQPGRTRLVVPEKEGLMICIPEWRKAVLSCAVLALPFVAG
ncbi:hypothetical protein [Burkholderia cenocepacia]|uniref:Uncharacterized protein n=1 Tax=Burkholderia cenocepacia TaxID=95486 RepID=A0ABD4U7C6_9BURK|nr:hypothetical protein [Burkholderia cenocepacia]MCW3696562.1 hypothetical protein [Burkholderia cenocepacia]MCW3702765.1 hypothetical protein [Burkholderia cenocepacia]MCW3710308.1 hypothetical protein [Burkholderia cenocepacia]MCW3717690.1 hypothetical protein [Burkholderia cenocepacia]MCW3727935.1 hypothetical protein [Burkholderia cenocepacia]